MPLQGGRLASHVARTWQRYTGCQNMQRFVPSCSLLPTCMKYLGRCFMSTCRAQASWKRRGQRNVIQHAGTTCRTTLCPQYIHPHGLALHIHDSN